jgi:spermidine synthase
MIHSGPGKLNVLVNEMGNVGQSGVQPFRFMKSTIAFRLATASIVFIFGALSMLAQILLLRALLVIVEGNEVFLGLFYSAWFFGIFLGAWLGGHCGRAKRFLIEPPLVLLALQATLLPALLVSARTVHANFGIPVAEPLGFAAIILILLIHLLPMGLLTGLIFPLLCQGAFARIGRAGSAMGGVYGFESLGSLAAGASFTCLLAGRVEALALACHAAAIVVLATAMATMVLLQGRRRTAWAGGFLLTGVFLACFCLPPIQRGLERWTTARWWRAYGSGMELLGRRETRYQDLAIAAQAGQMSLLCNGRFTASFPDPTAEMATAQLALAERPSPRNILLVGGIARGLVKHWLAANPRRVDVVEIDPELIHFLTPFLPVEDRRALKDPRVHVHEMDGRWFIKQQALGRRAPDRRYDLIVCLAPDPLTLALNRYYTREFFREAKAILADDGVFSFELSSAENYFGPEVSGMVGSVDASLREVFPAVVGAPGQRIIFFASKNPNRPTADVETLIRRWEGMRLSPQGFSPLYFHTAFEPAQYRFLKLALDRLALQARPNSDLSPVSEHYALRLWNRTSGSAMGWLFRLGDRPRPWEAAGLLAFLAACWVLAIPFMRPAGTFLPRARALLAIATTGATGIGISLILLLAFQALFGYLYQQVGLLAALFMAGLGSGSLISRGRPARPGRALAACEAGLVLDCALTALILNLLFQKAGSLAPNPALFVLSLLMFSAGAGVGAEFVLAGHLFRQATPKSGLTAARINAADHLGACVGAFLAGLVLLPALGMIGALIFLAGLKTLGWFICAVPHSSAN